MEASIGTRVPLGRFVNAARIGQLQEAARVAHSFGKIGLAESLREWTEQLIEVLAAETGDEMVDTPKRMPHAG